MFGGVCPSVTKERERERKKKEYREGEETVLWFREWPWPWWIDQPVEPGSRHDYEGSSTSGVPGVARIPGEFHASRPPPPPSFFFRSRRPAGSRSTNPPLLARKKETDSRDTSSVSEGENDRVRSSLGDFRRNLFSWKKRRKKVVSNGSIRRSVVLRDIHWHSATRSNRAITEGPVIFLTRPLRRCDDRWYPYVCHCWLRDRNENFIDPT